MENGYKYAIGDVVEYCFRDRVGCSESGRAVVIEHADLNGAPRYITKSGYKGAILCLAEDDIVADFSSALALVEG